MNEDLRIRLRREQVIERIREYLYALRRTFIRWVCRSGSTYFSAEAD